MIIDCGKAKSRARWLRYVAVALIALIIVGDVAWAAGGLGQRVNGAMVWVTASMSPSLEKFPRLLAIDVAIVSLIVVAGLYQLVRLMRRFEQGDFFSDRTMGHLRAFALLMLVAAVADCFLPPLIQLTAHLLGTPNVTSLDVGIDGTDIWLCLVSALFLMITTVMGEARKLAEDSELIV